MNRFVSTLSVFVLLALTIQILDAWTFDGKLKTGQKRMDKRRYKRQMLSSFGDVRSAGYSSVSGVVPASYAGLSGGPFLQNSFSCNYGIGQNCMTDAIQSGYALHQSINYVSRRNLFLGGLVSLSALQTGGMCLPNSNLFTANAFSAIDLGHLTLPQLATLNVFPVQTIDANSLLNANYISSYGQTNYFTGLGLLASIFGHITPSQLQPLSLYPLQGAGLTSDMLMQARYLTSDCLPTALGISALHVGYLSSDSLGSLGCGMSDYSSMSLTQLVTAKYVYGNLITPVGFAAMRVGYFTRESYQRYGVFPFGGSIGGVQMQQSAYYSEQSQQVSVSINDFVHVGYVHESSHFLTGAAYYALEKRYFTVENFRSLNVWPCPGTPTLNSFVAAGYASYSGHLTTLGYSLLHYEYFPRDWLPRIGIYLHDEFHLFHHALLYGDYLSSQYQAAHAEMHTASVYSTHSETSQTVQQQSDYSAGAATYGAVSGFQGANANFGTY